MTQGKWTLAALVVVGGAVLSGSGAKAAPTTQPGGGMATTRPAGRATHRKLPKPYADMKTLTPEQQQQVLKIHEDAVEQAHKIEDKERDDVEALLTPEQQTELDDIQGKTKAERKEKMLARVRKQAGVPTSQPTK